ncbi:mCG146311, partial [Mus musculus]
PEAEGRALEDLCHSPEPALLPAPECPQGLPVIFAMLRFCILPSAGTTLPHHHTLLGKGLLRTAIAQGHTTTVHAKCSALIEIQGKETL